MKESLPSNILSVFKVIIDNIPLIVAIITIGGAIKLFTYYKSFNVLVFSFMDIGEIVTLFASNLIPFVGVVILLILTVVLYHAPTLLWLMALPVAVIVGAILLNLFNPNIYFYESLIQIGSFLILYLIVVWLLNGLESGSIDSTLSGTILLFGLSATIISAGTMFALNEAYKVKNKKFYARVEVYINGKKIDNDDNNYFVGKTNDYLFFHHEVDNSTDVIPMSKVDRIVFK